MSQHTNYSIKVDQFEGPFDLLLFFIERDEMDIYNIQITKIIQDFLDFIHGQDKLNIELSSEFILFVSTLMRIKAKLLLPRKELDALGNELGSYTYRIMVLTKTDLELEYPDNLGNYITMIFSR